MKDGKIPNPMTIHPIIKKRFDDKMIELLEKFCWWDKSIEEINKLIPILTSSDLEMVRRELKKRK